MPDMRPKHIAWILAALLFAAAAMLVVRRTPSMGLSEVNSGIEALKHRPGIEFMERTEWQVSLVLGGRVEHWVRKLLRIPDRVAPGKIVDFRFRDSNGPFMVQYLIAGGQLRYVVIYTYLDSANPSAATMGFLKNSLPAARIQQINPR